MANVNVDVEYCGKCGYLERFQELSNYFTSRRPDVQITGHEGRRASFEVTVNGTVVHSKLSTLAFPDYSDLLKIADEAADGRQIERQCKQQAITDCRLM